MNKLMNLIADVRNSIHLEWLKYKNNTLARIIIGVFTVAFSFVILYGKRIIPNASPPLPGLDTYYTFPTVWDYQGHIGNWLVCVLFGFLMVHFITGEISAKTMRQGIINGQTRWDFYKAKFLVIVTLSTYATLIYVLSSVIIGILHTPDMYFSLIFDTNNLVGRFWLMSVGYLSLAFLIAMTFRTSGISVIFYFGYVFVIEFIFRMIQLYFFRNKAILFWPENSIEDLVPNPLYKLPSFWMEKEWGFSPVLSSWESIITSSFYITMMLLLAWRLFKRRDI